MLSVNTFFFYPRMKQMLWNTISSIVSHPSVNGFKALKGWLETISNGWQYEHTGGTKRKIILAHIYEKTCPVHGNKEKLNMKAGWTSFTVMAINPACLHATMVPPGFFGQYGFCFSAKKKPSTESRSVLNKKISPLKLYDHMHNFRII